MALQSLTKGPHPKMETIEEAAERDLKSKEVPGRMVLNVEPTGNTKEYFCDG